MRRTMWLFVGLAMAASLASAEVALGQGATMVVTPKTARAGDVVNVRSFNGGFSTATGTSGVVIRLATRSGRILRPATTPDPRGNINVDVPLPADLQPGWHLLLGTQTIEANNRQRSFTPARTRILITTAASAGSAAPGGGGGSSGPPTGLLVIGSVLILLATGATLTARKLRTVNQPPLGG